MEDEYRPDKFYREKSGSFGIYAVATLIIALFAGAAFYFSVTDTPREDYVIPREVVGRLDSPSRLVAHRLTAEPCNVVLLKRLATALLDNAEFAAAVSFIPDAEKRCGANDDLTSLLYHAQRGSADFKGAEKTVNDLLKRHSSAGPLYRWRAEARYGRGDIQGAYLDYRKSMELVPDPTKIVASGIDRLTQLAIEANRPCEAVSIMRDFIAMDNAKRRTSAVMRNIAEWRKAGSCPPAFGKGEAHLAFDPKREIILLPATVNGVRAMVIVDTGASRTVFTHSFAKRAHIAVNDTEELEVVTANGTVRQATGHAEHILLGGAHADDIPVLIQKKGQEGLGKGVDGLLGLSFLGNFEVKLAHGKLNLRPLE